MNYLKYIENTSTKLDLLLKSEFNNSVQLKSLKKNDFLVLEGDVCKYYYFLREGILRSYYLKNGYEITTSFTFPNNVATIYRSIILNIPSNEFLQAITECTVYQMNVCDFVQLKNQHPIMHEMENIFTTAYTLLLEERLFSVQFQTASERYKHLLEHYPQYIQFIPLKYIASYLGITLETLSRVRAKIN